MSGEIHPSYRKVIPDELPPWKPGERTGATSKAPTNAPVGTVVTKSGSSYWYDPDLLIPGTKYIQTDARGWKRISLSTI